MPLACGVYFSQNVRRKSKTKKTVKQIRAQSCAFLEFLPLSLSAILNSMYNLVPRILGCNYDYDFDPPFVFCCVVFDRLFHAVF